MNVDELKTSVAQVRERIDAARTRAGRTDEVTLVAVTKTVLATNYCTTYAVNILEDAARDTPNVANGGAAADGALYVRTESQLYKFAKR